MNGFIIFTEKNCHDYKTTKFYKVSKVETEGKFKISLIKYNLVGLSF